MQKQNNTGVENLYMEMLPGVSIYGDDSIIKPDKVEEAISKLVSSVSSDEELQALIKICERAECSRLEEEKPGLTGIHYKDSCKKLPDDPLNQKSKIGPRWKGKGAAKKALSDPISTIVAQLQLSLLQSNSQGILTSSGVLLDADAYQTDLLNRACFGRPYATANKDKQWFQLSMEEAFFLCYVLKCIKIVDGAENYSEKNAEQLFMHMASNQENFVNLSKAYSHLRLKNWVVRSGSQYGVDFVAYRHHPSLVHSEYAVLVLSEDDGEANGRLRVWSDVHCTLRLCGSVAKTLLVLNIQKHDKKGESLSNWDSYIVEERTISRWSPEATRN